MPKYHRYDDGDYYDDETVDLEISRVQANTGKAVLVHLSDVGEEAWIPVSQIANLEEALEDMAQKGSATLEVSEWLAEQRGWV